MAALGGRRPSTSSTFTAAYSESGRITFGDTESVGSDEPGQKEERTALHTHYCCHFARLVFLASHGILAILVSDALHDLQQASWWSLFLPIWVGDGLCAILIMVSWFASCPYVKLCLAERQPRLNNNPSILTEILPEIVLSMASLVFLVLSFLGEYFLCLFLSSSQEGHPHGLPALAVLLSLVAVMAMCHGALLLHNSALWMAVGFGLLVSTAAFVLMHLNAQLKAQAFVAAPALVTVLVLLLAAAHRLWRFRMTLKTEEKCLRSLEVLLLLLLLICQIFLVCKLTQDQLSEVAGELRTTGVLMCLLAVGRGRLCVWEAREGPLEDRLFCREMASGSAAREVGLSQLNLSSNLVAHAV